MYIVSACLAGLRTRYDGSHSLDERVKDLVIKGQAMPLCPEQLGGLTTPRSPINLLGSGRAMGLDGVDYTDALKRGAEEVLKIANLYGIKEAILKDGSPSCGVSYIRTPEGNSPGKGVTSGLLISNGIKAMTCDSIQGR